MSILWTPEYNFGFKIIDEQHQKFVETLNKLFDTYKSKTTPSMQEILVELDQYASEHFDTEEGYFKKFNYAGADEHIKAHQEFKSKINELKQELLADNMDAFFQLVDFLEDWLISHLGDMDNKYVQCFKEHGLT